MKPDMKDHFVSYMEKILSRREDFEYGHADVAPPLKGEE
jgi:hypothetical protein